jgi:hypothetical protein
MDLMPGNCERRPVPEPVPVPVSPVDWETVKKRIREALPWAVATVAIAGLAACFATGACELATVLTLVGAGAAVVIVGILRAAGISVGQPGTSTAIANSGESSDDPAINNSDADPGSGRGYTAT